MHLMAQKKKKKKKAAMDIALAVVVQPTSTVVQPVQPVQQPAVRAPARAAPVSHSSSPSIINVRPAQPVQQQQQQQQQQPPVQPQPQPTVAQVVQPHKRTSNMMEETSTLTPSTAIEPAPKRPAYAGTKREFPLFSEILNRCSCSDDFS